MTDIEELREAFRITEEESGKAHLTEQQWEALSTGDTSSSEVESFLEHIFSCGQCREIHKSILVLKDQAHTFDPGAPAPTRSAITSRKTWVFSGLVAVAATVLIVVLLPLGSFSPKEAPIPTGTNTTYRSAPKYVDAVPLSPKGQVSQSDILFTWRPSPSAPTSIIQLIDTDGEILWTSPETTAGSIRRPGERLPPGQYYWRILPVGGVGNPTQESEMLAFEVIEPSPSNPPSPGMPPS